MAKKKKKIRKEKTKEEIKIPKFIINFVGGSASSEAKESKDLYEQSRFGEIKEGKVLYSLVETLYLLEKDKVDIFEDGKKLDVKEFTKKAIKHEPNFLVRYVVFKDMRNRGYVVKTALKFGADFRVYDRGIKPGEDHAKWILYPVREGSTLTWFDFSAKNRVAHSTRKRLLIAIVDEENDVTYYSISWTRP